MDIVEGDEEWMKASLLFHQVKWMQSSDAIRLIIKYTREIMSKDKQKKEEKKAKSKSLSAKRKERKGK